MTITELIRELESRRAAHGDVEVMVTWEGIFLGIDPDTIYLSRSEPISTFFDCPSRVLLIDADGNSYKDKFADPDDMEASAPTEDDKSPRSP